jgi:hypothetical protein
MMALFKEYLCAIYVREIYINIKETPTNILSFIFDLTNINILRSHDILYSHFLKHLVLHTFLYNTNMIPINNNNAAMLLTVDSIPTFFRMSLISLYLKELSIRGVSGKCVLLLYLKGLSIGGVSGKLLFIFSCF